MSAEAGHAPNRVYVGQDGNLHLNGGKVYDSSENDITSTVGGVPVAAVAGVVEASKVPLLDSNKHIDTLSIADGGLKLGASGSETAVSATAAEINGCCHGQPQTATISPAAGGANVCLVTITVKDAAGNAITGPTHIDVYLSDASTGAGLTATTASGAVAAGASGVDLVTLVSKKALRVQTTAAGVYILSITDTSKTGFYPCVNIGGLKTVVGSQLVTGNYG